MGVPSTRKRTVRRWRFVVLAVTPLAVGVIGLLDDLPAGTAVADCFQRGYQPPPCSAGGQGGGTAPTPTSTVPDSGVNACQNQAAMATSLGLLPAVCPGTAQG